MVVSLWRVQQMWLCLCFERAEIRCLSRPVKTLWTWLWCIVQPITCQRSRILSHFVDCQYTLSFFPFASTALAPQFPLFLKSHSLSPFLTLLPPGLCCFYLNFHTLLSLSWIPSLLNPSLLSACTSSFLSHSPMSADTVPSGCLTPGVGSVFFPA